MILIFTLGLKAIFELFSGRQAGQVWPHLKILLVIGTICPDEFGCVTGIPVPYNKGSGPIIMTSPLPLL